MMADIDEFISGVILPPAFHAVLRRTLTKIEVAGSADGCSIAQARAEGMVEALELLKALEPAHIEALYLLIDQIATGRLLELKADQ